MANYNRFIITDHYVKLVISHIFVLLAVGWFRMPGNINSSPILPSPLRYSAPWKLYVCLQSLDAYSFFLISQRVATADGFGTDFRAS